MQCSVSGTRPASLLSQRLCSHTVCVLCGALPLHCSLSALPTAVLCSAVLYRCAALSALVLSTHALLSMRHSTASLLSVRSLTVSHSDTHQSSYIRICQV